ncbi:MAG: type IX secretion system outer membrane channel protein PorV [Bacteroidetes bacterium]|uniref:type IX secretion system outer membrane channel protein PorV n=1 Tax=Phnomibacter sp. TaxID=2836217 RepID=UPI002FDEBBB6|nr:type IX secretion system outer membrane channel protein PorV [Bacteroidota bacterium]
MRVPLRNSLLGFGLLTAVFAEAQQTINVVTTSVPFLRISPDARAGGMGDIGVATAPDANASFWNVAKTPFLESKAGISVTYTPWLKDIGVNDVFLAALAGYYKLDDESAVSGSLRYFNLGDIQFTDFSGNPLSTGKPTELAVDVSYSRKLTERWSAGASLRYINSNLARGYASSSGVVYQAGNTVAGDITAFYDGTDELGSGVRFGAALTNLGGKIGYTNNATEKDYIPANLGLGFTYTKAFDETNKIMFGIDINKLLVPTPPVATGDSAIDATALLDYRSKSVVSSWFSSMGDANGGMGEEFKELQFGLGAEYSYADQFFFRAGYFYEDKTKGNRKFFSVGLGLKFNAMGLNFSYLVPSGSGTNRNPLSNTLRFSLAFDFGAAE